jgi:hypothetical protein
MGTAGESGMNARLNPYTMRGPGDFDPPEDDPRDLAIESAGERIEADADKVRELITDAAGSIDDPMCSDMATDLLIALRELNYVFDRLTRGDTLEMATKTPDEAQYFRTLLRASNTADLWIAKLIQQEAASEVDDKDEL